ncbi:acetolactate synthase catalytic subunit [Agrobacterium rubi]|uniref:Acetolactate synthase catalytic subunit n=1 Tax=Agrobacterium rubi TaxID=28099 RepID=A0AAE7R830_9HYPH|nr:acetolactate synthase catalytic subunit [Agrobacterium rubi]NTE89518.1 acetolactate synthase catalytic subunit [Agrobacterium rubi]NTF05654.1 acetolactate synthase catalytic subunit [Agrobacterium rubi]NTF39655.1 acetolactate synthase catalytic subunit [Agrobacterium rubi]OCJ51012.1 acetolactate synthase catalytic subunit [Agrobacterium rubi]QTG03560.1 acetolactate synthase catalytic subunit [Agrobacterium rubi]
MDSEIHVTTVAERIARALKRHGVEVIFGQSLPSAVILAAENIGIRQVSYRQENMGGAMADGYARRSGKVGIVAAQNGPAAALLVAPLAEALKASVPVIALVQDVERDQTDRNAFQDLDHISLFQSCTKWVRRLTVEERVEDYVDAAFTAATSGRAGPAALLLPADLLRSADVASSRARRKNLGHWPLDRPRPSDNDLDIAAQAIAAARAPVVIAGGGVHASGAASQLRMLQDEAFLPVFTTNMGKGAVDEWHPLSAGVLASLVGPKSLGQHTVEMVREADLVILVGTRTNQNGTDNWRHYHPDADIIHIDADPQEVGRNYEAIRLVGDARETLAGLRQRIQLCDLHLRYSSRETTCARIRACWENFNADRQVFYGSDASPLRPERVMAELQNIIAENTTVVADASYSSMWVLGQLRVASEKTRIITPRGLAGLGWGVPLAIGAKVAAPHSDVVALVGDGGFAHSWAELETLVRMQIPITIIVLNNGILGFQRDAETVKFGKYTTACHFAEVDHVKIAQACGCEAVRISHTGELEAQIKKVTGRNVPLLIEVVTDPEAHPAISLFAQMDSAA